MKTVLITGAAKRIGAFVANYLHTLGFKIIIHYHQSEQEAQTLCKHLLQKRAKSAYLIQADLLQPECADVIIEHVQALTGELDVLIHNASIYTPFDKDWDAFFQLHVKTPYLLSLKAFPLLKKNSGNIINITDIQINQPPQHYSAYIQSKAALHAQTTSLALEFAPHVRVNEIAPGKILTPETGSLLIEHEILQKIPLKKRGDMLDIAKAVAFLIDSPYITGQTIRVDGGRSIFNG
jgi:pteridine reductase